MKIKINIDRLIHYLMFAIQSLIIGILIKTESYGMAAALSLYSIFIIWENSRKIMLVQSIILHEILENLKNSSK